MFRKLTSKIEKNECGASIIEFLVALGLAAVLITSGLDVLGPSMRIELHSKENEKVAALIEEHFEIVRSIRNENWNALFPEWVGDACDTGSYHYIDVEGEEGGLSLVECSAYFDKFLIGIYFGDVYRNDSGDIIESGTPDQLDDQTRRVTVQVDWETYGIDKSVSKSIYLTNWGAF